MIVYKFSTGKLEETLGQLEEKMMAALLMYAKVEAARLESEMKIRRPWRDRTGHAKQRLTVTTRKVHGYNGIRFTFAHNVDYGIFLELAHEKKYAIIEPTIRLESDSVMRNMQGILNRVK